MILPPYPRKVLYDRFVPIRWPHPSIRPIVSSVEILRTKNINELNPSRDEADVMLDFALALDRFRLIRYDRSVFPIRFTYSHCMADARL